MHIRIPYVPRPWGLELHNNSTRFRVIVAHRASGKALALDTEIATPDGFVTMGAIQVGDQVIDRDGRICNVIATSEIFHGHDCYEVEFSTGEVVICDADHLWITQSINERDTETYRQTPNHRITAPNQYSHQRGKQIGTTESAKTVVQIKDTLDSNYKTPTRRPEKQHNVRVMTPMQLPERMLAIHPYVFGYWLGDGASLAAVITVGEQDRDGFLDRMIEYDTDVHPFPSEPKNYQIGPNGQGSQKIKSCFKTKLRELGVLGNKHIPMDYLRASEEQRLQLLQGIMDSDGHCSKDGKSEITLINKRLIEDVHELMCSLGLRPSRITEADATLYGKIVGKKYRLSVTAYADQPIFSLPRKRDRLRDRKWNYMRHRKIVDVRPVPSVPTRCITVDSDTSTYCLGRSFIPTHNSIWAINELIRSAVTGLNDAVYLYILPQQNQARRNVWDNVKRFVAPFGNAVTMQNQTLETRFPNGAKLLLLGSDNPDSLRGLHVHGVVLDEVDDMHPDIWLVVRPTLTTHKAPCVFIGTPKGRQRLWEFYMRSQDPAYTDWYGVLLPWDKTGVLSADEVIAIKSEMSAEAFAQEMCCSFDSALIGAFYGRLIAEAREEGRIAYHDPSLYREDLEVYTSWDLGIRDHMSVWYFHVLGDVDSRNFELLFFDYDEYTNFGLPEWSQIIRNKPYRYAMHIAPFDIKNRELGSGISRLESAEELGLHFEQCPKQDPMDGIELVRRYFPKMKIDLHKCAQGVDRLSMYKSKLDKDGHPIGPDHNAASHAADSLRYAVTYVTQVLNQPAIVRVPVIRMR